MKMGCPKGCDVITMSITLLAISMAAYRAMAATTVFNVMSYGAVGNGQSDDSNAFLSAWKAACQGKAQPGVIPAVYVPPNKNFLLKPLTFSGPCKSSRIYVLVSGNITAPIKPGWTGKQKHAWMIFSYINGLMMKGKGVIDGQGSSWWPAKLCFNDPANGQNCKGPTGMIFNRCDGLRLDGISKINGPGSHVIISGTKDAVVSNIRITAPGDSPNTDGIDISGSTGVQIRNSFIATGDDCIAITAGSSNIDVSGITCGPGHGISIGSLGSGGYDVVENVRVRNCTLKQTLTGVRIKTRQGGKGSARKISFTGIKLEAVDNPIQIEQFYCPLRVNCQNYTSSAVDISEVSFVGISGTSVAENVINLNCNQKSGCKNINLDRVYIKSSTEKRVYASCNNAHGRATHTRPAVNCLLP